MSARVAKKLQAPPGDSRATSPCAASFSRTRRSQIFTALTEKKSTLKREAQVGLKTTKITTPPPPATPCAHKQRQVRGETPQPLQSLQSQAAQPRPKSATGGRATRAKSTLSTSQSKAARADLARQPSSTKLRGSSGPRYSVPVRRRYPKPSSGRFSKQARSIPTYLKARNLRRKSSTKQRLRAS